MSLDLSRNQLKRLPPSELNRLSGSLEHLTVSFNALSSFPSAVRGLSSLKELDLSHNVISYLPKGKQVDVVYSAQEEGLVKSASNPHAQERTCR